MDQMSPTTVHPASSQHHLKDPASSISHQIATALGVAGTLPLLFKAAHTGRNLSIISMAVFSLSLVLLYLASSLYHGVCSTQTVERRLKKFDHMMVYVLIAGT